MNRETSQFIQKKTYMNNKLKNKMINKKQNNVFLTLQIHKRQLKRCKPVKTDCVNNFNFSRKSIV